MVTMASSRSSLMAILLLLGRVPALAGSPLEGLIHPVRQVEVAAPVSARLVAMKVQEGDSVKEGQPLAVLYGRLEELEMQRAKALLERREFEAKGARRLYDNRIIPESKALETRIDLDLARLQYETAEEQVRLRTILSPLSGVVVQRLREAGETILSTQPLFRIQDLSRVVVICRALPGALAEYPLGAPVAVRLSAGSGGAAFSGTVVLVDPCADEEGRVRVKVEVDNASGRIRSGLRAWVEPAPR